MGDLALDTAVIADPSTPGRYTAALCQDWEIWGPNGGYLAAVALRAAGVASVQPRPASFSCSYLAVADFDEVVLDVETRKAAKRAECLHVRMHQRGNAILDATVWTTADTMTGLAHDHAVAPSVDGPDGLRPLSELVPDQEGRYRFWRNLEEKPIGWIDDPAQREPGDPAFTSWYRYTPGPVFEDPYVEAGRLVILLDTMSWPAACQAHRWEDNTWMAPSLDLAAQFHRAGPHSEWLLADTLAPIATEGLIGFTSRVWSSDRALLASGSGTLLCRPMPGR